jgi:hypothetical protein
MIELNFSDCKSRSGALIVYRELILNAKKRYLRKDGGWESLNLESHRNNTETVMDGREKNHGRNI